MCCKNFGRFHHRKFKKITNKAIKTVKKTCLGIYNSRLKPTILTEMIAKHYLIIGYYMY